MDGRERGIVFEVSFFIRVECEVVLGFGVRVGRFGVVGERVGVSILVFVGGAYGGCWLFGKVVCWGGEGVSLF